MKVDWRHMTSLFMHDHLPCHPEQMSCDITLGNSKVTLKDLSLFAGTIVNLRDSFVNFWPSNTPRQLRFEYVLSYYCILFNNFRSYK